MDNYILRRSNRREILNRLYTFMLVMKKLYNSKFL